MYMKARCPPKEIDSLPHNNNGGYRGNDNANSSVTGPPLTSRHSKELAFKAFGVSPRHS